MNMLAVVSVGASSDIDGCITWTCLM